MMITQEYLKENIIYNPDTGCFYWKIFKTGRKMNAQIGAINKSGYYITTINYKTYLLHRLAFLYMDGCFPENNVDHIDNNKLNNKWKNLRHATNFENAQNKLLQSNNKSGYKGVCWDKHNNRWKASIDYNGKSKHIGMFINKDSAINAIKNFRPKVHNEFANHG